MRCQKSGPWAIAQQPGQLPLWIYKPIWAATYILCMTLAATGEAPALVACTGRTPLSPCCVRARSGWPGHGGCGRRDHCGFTGRRYREMGEEPSP